MNDPQDPGVAASSRPPTPSRHRLAATTVLVSVLVLAGACSGEGSSSDTTAAPSTTETATTEAPTTTTVPELVSLEVVEAIDAGRQLWTGTLVGRELWVPRKFGVTVISVDDGSTTLLEVEGATETPLFAAGRVWVPNLDVPTLTVFDPATKEARATIPVGEQGFTPVALGGYIWVPNRDDATVSRVDLGTFETLTIPLSPGFNSLRVVDGHVEARASDAYWRIDLDGTATEVDDPGPLPVEVLGDVFRLSDDRTTVLRSSTPDGDPDATIPIGSAVNDLIVTGDWLWARTATGFARIDPITNTADESIDVDSGGGYVGSERGLWIATRGEDDGVVTFIESETATVVSAPVEGRPDTPAVVDDGAYVSLVFGSRTEQVVRIEPVFE